MALNQTHYDAILFLDFDGTITTEDTLDGCMRRYIDPEFYQEKAEEMLAGKLTLADVVHLGFSNIPSEKLPDLLEYVRSISIRPGFAELLDAMSECGIPVVIISGGLQPYVEEKLKPYQDKLLAVHSVGLDLSGQFMRLVSDYEGNGEIVQKTLIMAQYDYRHGICVGDSYTDINMAKNAQTVFARDKLADILGKLGKPFIPWKDFYEVRDSILSSR
jgi:2-hydroxy-3-keto-5-methylthiopentenyl-1-phosphate phosphatase